MPHLTGQGTPGCWSQPSFPTVTHCSLRGETWQPVSSQMGVFSLLWWATPSPGTHSLCLSSASRPQALTTKSARLFGGLTSDVRSHRAKPRTQRTSRHISVQWRVRGWQPQTACPSPALAPCEPSPWFLTSSGQSGESTGGKATDLLGVLLLAPGPAGQSQVLECGTLGVHPC